MKFSTTKSPGTILQELDTTRSTMKRQDLLKQLWQLDRLAQAADESNEK